jgi:hypothetical protein
MGGAVIGVADDGAAWMQNPAGLAALNVPVMEGKIWGADAIGTYANMDDIDEFDSSTSSDAWGINISGYQPAKGVGFGGGYSDAVDIASIWGLGAGMAIKDSPFSLGLNFVDYSADSGPITGAQVLIGDDDATMVSLGALYRVMREEGAPVRLGLVVQDLFGDSHNGPFFNLGVAWPATPDLLVAVDVLDITDETNLGPYFNAGLELRAGKMKQWAVRAGLTDTDDTDFTVGAGLNLEKWRLDAAYADIADGMWAISAATSF